jgi:hypothetical protein
VKSRGCGFGRSPFFFDLPPSAAIAPQFFSGRDQKEEPALRATEGLFVGWGEKPCDSLIVKPAGHGKKLFEDRLCDCFAKFFKKFFKVNENSFTKDGVPINLVWKKETVIRVDLL